MKNAKHQSKSQEHYTPAAIIERSRYVLGAIDLDPASCALANEAVRATNYYTAAEGGLSQPWGGRLFVNPPGGKDSRNRSNAKQWWFKLASEWLKGNVLAAIFVGFSIELLQTCQVDPNEGVPLPLDFPFMIPRQRIEFLRDVAGQLVVGDSPTHANAIVYLPPKMDKKHYRIFHHAFWDLGRVVHPEMPQASLCKRGTLPRQRRA